MPPPSKVYNFFNEAAKNYQFSSESWPWKMLRDKEVAAVKDQLGNVREETVLDVGSGAGFYTRMALNLGAKHVVAIDLSQAMINQLPINSVTGIVGDASTIKLDKSYSKLIMAGLLEFAPDTLAVLQNLRRHARKGAVLVVLVPQNNMWARIYQFYHLRHGIRINLFTSGDLVDLGTSVGWEYISEKKVFPFSIIMRFRAV